MKWASPTKKPRLDYFFFLFFRSVLCVLRVCCVCACSFFSSGVCCVSVSKMCVYPVSFLQESGVKTAELESLRKQLTSRQSEQTTQIEGLKKKMEALNKR